MGLQIKGGFFLILLGANPAAGAQPQSCKDAFAHVLKGGRQFQEKSWQEVCKQVRVLRKNAAFRKVETFVDRRLADMDPAQRRNWAGCLIVLPMVPTAFAFEDYRDRRRMEEKRDWISENGSNLVEGTLAMAAGHCLVAINMPGYQMTRNQFDILVAGLIGLNTAGNIWEEIDLGIPEQKSLPFFLSGGNHVKTDWEDFKSGLLATVSFLTVMKLMALENPVLNCP